MEARAYQHRENISFNGKNLTVRSTDPEDPDVVAETIINGSGQGPAVSFSGGEGSSCVLGGFTITDGNEGIWCWGASPTIVNCRIVGNKDAGVESWYVAGWRRSATVVNCTIGGNGGAGIMARGRKTPTVINSVIVGNKQGGIDTDESPIITNCTIIGNGVQGISAYNARITNCIVRDNCPPQIVDYGVGSISYCNVQGGWSGEGNIDAKPGFAEPGYWDANEVWVGGDCHLLASSPCIDAGENTALPADIFDLDGDGNTTEPIPWDLDGNGRVVDGDNDGTAAVDMGAYEFSLPLLEVEMQFTPEALNPESKGRWVKAHLVFPAGYTVRDVDVNKPVVLEPGGIEAEYMNVFVNDANLVEVEAAFARGQLCSAGLDGNGVEVTVTGSLTSGQLFYGVDTIKITNNVMKYLAGLASYWLEGGCGRPDWCGGFDADGDSVVTFVDFALMDGCCVEIMAD